MIVNNDRSYEVIYNLSPGDTFVFEGIAYMILSPSYYNSVSKKHENLLSDGMREVAAV